MALITCNECGREISNKAKVCPNCGSPINTVDKDKVFQIILCLSLTFITILVVAAYMSSDTPKINVAFNATTTSKKANTTANKPITTAATTPITTAITTTPTTSESIQAVPTEGWAIFNHDDIVITIYDFKRDSNKNITGLEVLIENNSSVGKTIAVSTESVFSGTISVNGYSMNCYFSVDVVNGKKAKATLDFDSDTLEVVNFNKIYDINIPFGMYDLERDGVMKENIMSYETSSLHLNDYTLNPVGTIAYDDNGIEIYKRGFDTRTVYSVSADFNGFIDYNYAYLIIKNNTGEDKCFNVDKMSINGMMAGGYNYVSIYNGECAIYKLELGEDYNENNIQNIEFTLESGEFNQPFFSNPETIDVISINY